MKEQKWSPLTSRPCTLVRRDLERFVRIAADLESGLAGVPFRWGSDAQRHWLPLVEQMGFHLRTQAALECQGFRLKADAQPVGEIYYPAPLSRFVPVYVLECQCEGEGHATDPDPTARLIEIIAERDAEEKARLVAEGMQVAHRILDDLDKRAAQAPVAAPILQKEATAMIEVENKVNIYRKNGQEIPYRSEMLLVKSTGVGHDRVVIEHGDLRLEVVAKDLHAAINNAINNAT